MPEENGQGPSSGVKPGEKKPTVIGGGKTPPDSSAKAHTEHKPTVIGGASSSVHSAGPTVFGGGQPSKPSTPDAPGKPPVEKKPTAFPGAAPKPTASPSTKVDPEKSPPVVTHPSDNPGSTHKPTAIPANPTPRKPMAVTHPSAMPGTVRKFVEVEIADLEGLFPGTPEKILSKAKLVLGGTVLELLTETKCIQWGENEQRQFGELADKSSQLIGNQAVLDAGRHLVRLNAVLNQVSDALHGKSAGLFRRSDPRREFDQHQPEIYQLKDLLEQLLPILTDTKSNLAALSTEFQELFVELNGSSIAARYIADKLLQSGSNVARVLTDRSNSLTETAAYIQQGQVLREQMSNTLTGLITQVQNTVLTRVPVWIESVIAVLQKPTQTETDLYNLRQGLDGILLELKG